MSSKKSSSTRLSSDQKPAFAYANVVFNLPLKDEFTYEIPLHFNGMVKKGMRVLVPFGRRRLTGYVVSISNHNKKKRTNYSKSCLQTRLKNLLPTEHYFFFSLFEVDFLFSI